MSRIRTLVLALVVLTLALATPAIAATTTGYAAWTPLVGSSTDFTTTMKLSPKFPGATVTTDSRSGQVGVQTGNTMWLGANTPFGQRFGSSQGKPYLNLRPKVDNAGGASTTTYTFERGTPLGWGFALGDIDADQVRVSATKADGTPASAGDLGFEDTFNLCAVTPRPSGCSGSAGTDVPTWSAATRTLTGNTGAVDTTGATGWFEPTASLRTLTFEFTQRSGFPVYQTWFALRMHDIAGTVTGACDLDDVRIDLIGALGNVFATTTPDASGAFSFDGLAASSGYRVAMRNLPDGCRAVGPTTRPIDLTSGDGTTSFDVRAIIPAAVSGTVRDSSGDPVGGVTVTLTPAGGGVPITTTTAEDGTYIFDDNAPGDYTVEIDAPDGYGLGTPASRDVTIPAGDDTPITGQDFALVDNPSVSGKVTAGGEGVPGLTVELRDGGTVVARTVTGADGAYTFERVPGDVTYTVAVPDPTGGYRVPTPLSVPVTDEDSAGNDIPLTRPGSISGTVTNTSDKAPVSGATVRVTGPGGFDRTLTTDAAGNYALEDLDPGTYEIALTLPDGTSADGPATRTVTITDAGESFGIENFAVATIDQTPEPSPGGGDDGDGGGNTGGGAAGDDSSGAAALPDTGGPSRTIPLVGISLLLSGVVLVGAGRARRRSVT